MQLTPSEREEWFNEWEFLIRITAGRLSKGLPPNVDRADMYQIAAIGLLRAIDQFNPKHKSKAQFRTFAITHIRGALLEFLRGEDWLTRNARDKIKKMELATTTLRDRLAREPTEDELATELGLTYDQLSKWRFDVLYANPISTSEFLITSDIDNRLHVEDTIEDPNSELEPLALKRQERAELLAAIASLPEREQKVLRLYYYNSNTFKEIGRQLQVSESRIFQLHQQAMSRIRRRFDLPARPNGQVAA
jgi:RNA polymerase sigma factor for flagellar operon FliA